MEYIKEEKIIKKTENYKTIRIIKEIFIPSLYGHHVRNINNDPMNGFISQVIEIKKIEIEKNKK